MWRWPHIGRQWSSLLFCILIFCTLVATRFVVCLGFNTSVFYSCCILMLLTFTALTLLVERQEGHLALKPECWYSGGGDLIGVEWVLVQIVATSVIYCCIKIQNSSCISLSLVQYTQDYNVQDYFWLPVKGTIKLLYYNKHHCSPTLSNSLRAKTDMPPQFMWLGRINMLFESKSKQRYTCCS